MATIEGGWIPNASANARMQLQIEVTVPPATVGATSVTVTGTIYVYAGSVAIGDTSTTFSIGGSLLGASTAAKNILVPVRGRQALATFSKTVNLTKNAQGHTISAALTGVAAFGAAVAQVSGVVSIPALIPAGALPPTPTGVTVSRRDDEHYIINYTGDNTAGLIDRVWVVRETVGGGSEVIVNAEWQASGVATGGASDKGTRKNNRYRWRVAFARKIGSSWVASSYVYANSGLYFETTPSYSATPSKVTRSGSNFNVALSLPKANDRQWWDRQEYAIQYRGESWGAWSNIAKDAASFTFADSGNLKDFRVKTRSVVTDGGTLYGPEKVLSNWVAALAKPNPPTIIAPTKTLEPGTIQLDWDFNPVDASDQTAYELRFRNRSNTTTWTTRAVSVSTTSRYEILTAGDYEWQVRAKGLHADYSDWSRMGTFTIAEKPTLAVSVPPLVDTNRARFTVVYGDAQGAAMVSWRRQLLEGGVVVEDMTGTGSHTIFTARYILKNHTDYEMRAWATSGTGLTSEYASASWTTDFDLPFTPALLEAAWDEETGTVRLTAGYAVDPAPGEIPATHFNIERSMDGGVAWDRIVEGLPENGSIADSSVDLNARPLYRAVSVSALETVALSEIAEVPTPTLLTWFSSSEVSLSLECGMSWDHSVEHEAVFEEYLGHEQPVAYFGERLSESADVTATVRTPEEAKALRGLLRRVIRYRDPAGRNFTAVLDQGVSVSNTLITVGQASLKVRRVENGAD